MTLRTAVLAMLLASSALYQPAQGSPEPVARSDADAPRERSVPRAPPQAASYAQALERWQGVDDVNAWIGANFQYDPARALQLSETQRASGARMAIYEPARFFSAPKGVCVDLARFAVEAVRALEPGVRPVYLMIEFDPIVIEGNTLRRHWVVAYRRDSGYYVFADSIRPGYVAGPYATLDAYIADYARYRGRRIVGFDAREGYERRMRQQRAAVKAGVASAYSQDAAVIDP